MDFSRLDAYVDSLQAAGVPGCDLVVYRDHEMIYRRLAGFRDADRTLPVAGDETYCLYSCSKVFTTCAAMQLIERGILHLDDPVSRWLPAYADLTVREGDAVRPAARVMTVRHLMSMQSGLDYELDTPAIRAALEATNGAATTRELVDAIAKGPLSFDPGMDFQYSLSHDVLAAVIEAASGLRFSEYLRENIFQPLGLETVAFTMDGTRADRLCAQYEVNDADGRIVQSPAQVINYRLGPNYESGGAGLISDVRDCITFADALACGGAGANGARVLSPEMIQLWSANQLGAKARKSFDEWQRLGYSYALGVRTRVNTAIGGRGQIGEFGWDGAAGAWMMIDPINHLSAYYAMHVRNFNYSYDVIHPTIRDLIYGSVMGS